MAAASCFLLKPGKSQERTMIATADTSTVVQIGSERISNKEFLWRMNANRSACFDFFIKKYNVLGNGPGFWHQRFDSITPLQWIKKRTLEQLIADKEKIKIMQQYGLLQGFDHEQFLKAHKDENEKRKALVEKGQVIYGLQQFDDYTFYEYILSNALLETQRRMLATDPPPEKIVQDRYNREKEQFAIPPTICATFVTKDTQINISLEPATRRADQMRWGTVFHFAVMLKQKGDTSQVFKDDQGNEGFLVCTTWTNNGYLTFSQVRDNLRTHIAAERFNRLLKRKIRAATVKVYPAAWKKIEVR